MDFRRLIEAECGQSNPLVGLASHVARGGAYQGATNFQSSSNEQENLIFPQTFRTDDIMQQIQNAERKTYIAPENSWIDEYRNPFDSSNASMNVSSSIMNASQHESGTFFSQYHHLPTSQLENRFQIGISPDIREPLNEAREIKRLDDSAEFASYFLDNEGRPRHHLQSVEEAEKLRKEWQERLSKSDDNPEDLQKGNIETDEPNEEKELIYFDGLCTEDVHKAKTPDIVRSEAENFIRFVINYIKKFQKRDFDVQDEKEYIFRENNPYIKDIDRSYYTGSRLLFGANYTEAVSYFEAAVQLRPNCSTAWQNLMDSLKWNGEYYNAFCVAKQALHLDRDYYSKYIYSFLFHEQYYYQGCQVIINWLRNHPDYRDIVPSFFKMEDKSSTLVTKEQLAEIKKMLIKAAQRRPVKPDWYVQIALSKLLQITQDYEKSGDCMLAMANNVKNSDKLEFRHHSKSQRAWLKVGFILLQSNKPHAALEVSRISIKRVSTELELIDHDELAGLVNLYLKNYEKAGRYYLSALTVIECNIGWGVHDLHKENVLWTQLHLCAELMRRPDLLALVKERNLSKLCEEFKYQRRAIFINNISWGARNNFQ